MYLRENILFFVVYLSNDNSLAADSTCDRISRAALIFSFGDVVLLIKEVGDANIRRFSSKSLKSEYKFISIDIFEVV